MRSRTTSASCCAPSSTSTSAGSPTQLADAEAAKYAGRGSRRLHFAWAGGIEVGEPHYYRIQGPRLLVEYDNTQRDVNHVHSVWRDPDGDFGDDILARHYRETGSGHVPS